jgi:tripartite-type tricarboxylate transporter receptor subunit TctC
MLAISANAINASLYGKLNFNFIRDIAPVASISTIPLVMEVNPAVPAHTVPKFIAYAKANPGKINMASGGTGSPLHVAGELFKMMAGVDMIHVPYRSEALALPDLISGQLQIMFGVMPWPIRPHISEGRRRCPRPNECRSAHCGRRSSPTAATPARTPPGGQARLDRRRQHQ